MNFFWQVCLFLVLFHIAQSKLLIKSQQPNEPIYYFPQQVSHFDISVRNVTFQQRYFIFDDFYKKDVSILYINGEAQASGTPNNYVKDMARELGARVVTVEHRYYGKSLPYSLMTTQNLKYLSSSEALADYANIITTFNQKKQDKWIVVGCSYPGALSAFFRLKYPHLVVGSISSSGVVNAILNFVEFDEQIRQSAGPVCAENLQWITQQLELQVQQDPNRVLSLFDAQVMADYMDDFWFFIADAMSEPIQYGFHDQICGRNFSSVEDFAQWAKTFYYPKFDPQAPLHYSTKFLQQLSNKDTADNAARLWTYQTCVEFGFFQNAPATQAIRSQNVNMAYWQRLCNRLFGLTSLPNTKQTNLNYGGDEIQSTNTMLNNASQDPWQRAGLLSPNNKSQVTRMIQCSNCGHCADLRGCPSLPSAAATTKAHTSTCNESGEGQVKKVREEMIALAKQWLLS